MALKESKHKYDDEEDQVSIATSKRRRPFGDYNGDNDSSSSEKEVSSEEESARPPCSDDGGTCDAPPISKGGQS
jgi:hypothetical protein